MLENALFTLVRSTLLDGFEGLGGDYAGVLVGQLSEPLILGAPATPSVLMQTILTRRYGPPRRNVLQPGAGSGADDMSNQYTQWIEHTLQIGAIARRDPTAADFLTLPSANDICKAAANILQLDAGLAALAVQRVRPLRVTEIRNVKFVNESDQYEAMPSFDLTLVYPELTSDATPPAITIEPDFGRV
jgi:hypothetical protein